MVYPEGRVESVESPSSTMLETVMLPKVMPPVLVRVTFAELVFGTAAVYSILISVVPAATAPSKKVVVVPPTVYATAPSKEDPGMI